MMLHHESNCVAGRVGDSRVADIPSAGLDSCHGKTTGGRVSSFLIAKKNS